MTRQSMQRVGIAVVATGVLALATPALRAQHAAEPSTAGTTVEHGQAPATAHAQAPGDHAAPAGEHAAPAGEHGAAEAGHGEPHGESLWVTLARIANFAILAGVLYWFGRKPLADHLARRRAQIRKDLVDAAETKQLATQRLADIEAKLAALPVELEALRTRGAEELASERSRIRAAAETERDRLVEQARREIESQTRGARAQLRAHAAELAVDVARARLEATLTPAEQSALVDTYATQMRNVQ